MASAISFLRSVLRLRRIAELASTNDGRRRDWIFLTDLPLTNLAGVGVDERAQAGLDVGSVIAIGAPSWIAWEIGKPSDISEIRPLRYCARCVC